MDEAKYQREQIDVSLMLGKHQLAVIANRQIAKDSPFLVPMEMLQREHYLPIDLAEFSLHLDIPDPENPMQVKDRFGAESDPARQIDMQFVSVGKVAPRIVIQPGVQVMVLAAASPSECWHLQHLWTFHPVLQQSAEFWVDLAPLGSDEPFEVSFEHWEDHPELILNKRWIFCCVC